MRDDEGRLLLLNVEYKSHMITLVCLYAPTHNKDRKEFLEKVENIIVQNMGIYNNLIIAGDLNICRFLKDRNTGKHINDKSRESLNKF